MSKEILVSGQELNDQIKSLRFNVIDFHPFFCDYKDLDGKLDFKKITKWELIRPFTIFHTEKSFLYMLSPGNFEIRTDTNISLDKISIKISIEEM